MGAWDDESIGVEIPQFVNPVAPDFPLAEGQPTMFDVGGYYNPVSTGSPSTWGFDPNGIFRTVADVVSPFAQSFLKTVSGAFGQKITNDILGIKPVQLSYASSAPKGSNVLPTATRVPGYSAMGSYGGGGNPYPILSGSGSNPMVWALVGLAALVAVMVVRK